MSGEHRVWFTRFGVPHYYPAESREDADRWIRVYLEIGGVEITSLELPDGTHLKMSDLASQAGLHNN
jgi:hypothetical protein